MWSVYLLLTQQTAPLATKWLLRGQNLQICLVQFKVRNCVNYLRYNN